MNTLDELERLLKAATPGPWTHASDKLSAGNIKASDNAALIVAAINALPGLIASARRELDLEGALQAIAERHVPDQPEPEDTTYTARIRKHQIELRNIARAALQTKGPTT